jgi:molybdopterin synthase catalytic subunit
MNTADIINKIKDHKDSNKMGMIASHLGIVRGNSRNGKEVNAVEVVYDMKVIDEIIHEIKSMDGIVEVIVEINEGRLNVGDELMFVAVGGDIRENVFPALIKAVDLLKTRASNKKEIFME